MSYPNHAAVSATAEAHPSNLGAAGRSCPLHYHYGPAVFNSEAAPALRDLEVLYVVGGLYGSELALDEVLRLFERERGRKCLVFNGDFHWFDVEPALFSRIQREVMAHTALRGNVETELTELSPGADAGCGCAYPEWVGDAVVQRSNKILQRLRGATTAALRGELAALPMWLRADVGPMRLGVVHGDAQSLAGWGFAQEHLADPQHRQQARDWFARARVDAFASTHTCLPVYQRLHVPGHPSPAWIFNNGAAGMPNFTGDSAGLLTRISTLPYAGPAARAAIVHDGVFVDAVPIEVDPLQAQRRFLAQWPDGSDAHASYFARIVEGPAYRPDQIVRLEE